MQVTGLRVLRDLLAEHAAQTPDAPALVFERESGEVTEFTYAQLEAQTDRLAAGFESLGVTKGQKVALRLTNRWEFVLSWFALAKLGAVAVPIIATITQSETDFTLERADIEVVVTDPTWVPLYQQGASPLLRHIVAVDNPDIPRQAGTVPFEQLLEAGSDYTRHDIAPRDVQQMMFTSGSTSAPKCVMLTQANAMNVGDRLARSLGLRPGDRNLSPLPFFHANCQGNAVLSSITAGATAVILERFSVRHYWEQVRRHGATIGTLALPGAMLALEPTELDAQNDMRMAFAGTPLPPDRTAEFEKRFGITLILGYGLTEASTDVVITPLFAPRRSPSVGLPTPGRIVRILDDDGVEVPQGERGEVVLQAEPGDTVMLGYYKDDVATAEALHDGYLFTGDLGHFDDHGYLYFDGRKKDIIKRAGENVAALEVENALVTHEQVLEAAVFGVPDEVLGERVMAVVILREEDSVDEEALLAHLTPILAPFKVPSEIEIRTELPRTGIGKIVKPQLRAEALERLGIRL
ncbi:class I adenylate-forming enzyme family protein [Microbacterium sp.]|uniref:class I adenylate-forming enzyme family protein n=1 Tax=Microbacterium sp. TaxID=51671 RepID=UPI003A84032A